MSAPPAIAKPKTQHHVLIPRQPSLTQQPVGFSLQRRKLSKYGALQAKYFDQTSLRARFVAFGRVLLLSSDGPLGPPHSNVVHHADFLKFRRARMLLETLLSKRQ
jgi:hypothetical protein